MSSVKTYKCDRCQATSTNKHDLGLQIVAVGTKLEPYHNYTVGISIEDYSNRTAEWCENCLRETGVIRNISGAAPISEPVPTLEDIIRQICREEIEQAKAS